jgi:hypothetical protein
VPCTPLRSRRLFLRHARQAPAFEHRLESAGHRQLADAGIDASAILPPRPTITVEAGLMTTLMSMR